MPSPSLILRRRGAVITSGLLLLWLATGEACARQEAGMPAELQQGEAAFTANCARCHGERGIGTTQGPPLVHKIYEPNHHGDPAFQRAAANGVRAHHWQFGDMPKIDGVTPDDVDQVIKYIRWLQRQAGIM
ncbi:MAG: cytochrome c [Nitrospira sp.]|nr:cytochrome c [Nitrospira sp.]